MFALNFNCWREQGHRSNHRNVLSKRNILNLSKSRRILFLLGFVLGIDYFRNKWPLSGTEQREIPVTADMFEAQVLNLWSLLRSTETHHWSREGVTACISNQLTQEMEMEKNTLHELESTPLIVSKTSTNKHGWTVIDGSAVNRSPNPTLWEKGGCQRPEINSNSEAC